MKKSVICIFTILLITALCSCFPNKPVKTYDSLEALKSEEKIDFIDINNPVAFFESKTISKISSEDHLDITVIPDENTECSINFESKNFHIQVIKYSHLLYSISSEGKDYSSKIIDDIELEYYFEDSIDKNLIFGFKNQDCYYKYIVIDYKTTSEQELLDILYQYITTL